MNDQTFEGEEIFAEPERAPAATKPNGHATGVAPAKAPKPKSKFASVGADTMRTAKKGGVSKSRTGKARQVTVEFGKPPKHLYVKVHPNPEYRQNGIAIFFDQDRDTAHYIPADLYEGDTLPERFKRACKIVNVFTCALADRTFMLWTVNQSSSKWFKAAMRAVEAATKEFVLVEAVKARSTYYVEPSDGTVPEPAWEQLPPFEKLLEGAFDSEIIGPNDEIVNRYMAGGNWDEDGGDE